MDGSSLRIRMKIQTVSTSLAKFAAGMGDAFSLEARVLQELASGRRVCVVPSCGIEPRQLASNLLAMVSTLVASCY